MVDVKIADIAIRFHNSNHFIEEKCSDYIIEDQTPDLEIKTDPEGVCFWKEYINNVYGVQISEGEGEAEYLIQDFYKKLSKFQAFWMHACVVEMDQMAYAFTAPSGYGKTTHAMLWLKVFGERARIINGDNPIIRLKQGNFYIYGTPFCGKEGWNVNKGVPLKGICYLQRSDHNELKKMSTSLGFAQLLRSGSRFITKENAESMMSLYKNLAEAVPVYSLKCNMEEEAARIAYEGMKETGSAEKI